MKVRNLTRIPQEIIEQVREQTNIVDVVGQYVQLKKSGKNYLGLCPFHEERSPSFSVAEDKQIFHCFGCGKGGSVYQFIQEIEGLNFPEAVEKVADLSHIKIDYQFQPDLTPAENTHQKHTNELIKLHESAADLYHHILLKTKVGEKAFNYLIERGVTEEQIKEFQIGFAPVERTLLKQIFERDEVSDDLLSASGLMTQRDDGEFFDRFFGRIMFPIKNDQGKVIAFSGRLFVEDELKSKKMPKYLNSPETDVFNKRKVLYNFHQARQTGRKENELVLFEGFMDVIAASGAGVKNGVASMGTSLTNEQLLMFQRTVKKVLVCYDGDSAGKEASYRALQSFTEYSSLEISLMLLPEGLDPDEFIQKYGRKSFVTLLKNQRESAFTFKMNYFKQGKNLDNEHDRLNYLEIMINELSKISSVIEREMYIQQLAELFQISEEAIYAEVSKSIHHQQQTRRNKRHQTEQHQQAPINYAPPQVQQKKKLTLVERTEQMLLYRIFQETTVASKIRALENFSFAHDEYQELFQHFCDYMLLHGQFVLADFLNYLKETHLRQKLIKITYVELSDESTSQEIEDYINIIGKNQLELLKEEKINQQREAARVGNSELELSLTIEIINIQRQLKG